MPVAANFFFLFLIQTQAKLSCLVMKCQERNCLLAHMMTAMHRHGCADLALTQQAERLLGDHALQQYSNAFAPETRTRDCSWDWGPQSASQFQDYPKKRIPQDVVSEPRGIPDQNVEANQPVSPLEEHASVRATQPPGAPGLNEDLDTTQVRKTNKKNPKHVSIHAIMIGGNKGKLSGLCVLFCHS